MRSTATVDSGNAVDVAAILDPNVHIAIWRRPIQPRIADLFARPDWGLDRRTRLVFRPDGDLSGRERSGRDPSGRERSGSENPDRDFANLLPAAARAADPLGTGALAADVARLCGMFAQLLSADQLSVSLESPDEATCPRFHVDRVGIRMLVTYAGPGTQWLAHEHVDRDWLGSAGHGRTDEESGLMLPGAQVQQVAPFDVVLLKGEAWPGAAGFGVVHRSPNPQGGPRVLLRVDLEAGQ